LVVSPLCVRAVCNLEKGWAFICSTTEPVA